MMALSIYLTQLTKDGISQNASLALVPEERRERHRVCTCPQQSYGTAGILLNMFSECLFQLKNIK